jgi:hypothetical protein
MAFGLTQSRKFLPRFSAIGRLENRRVLHPGIDRIRVGQRGLQMPDALEFPRVLRAVVPLVPTNTRTFPMIAFLLVLVFCLPRWLFSSWLFSSLL